MILRISAAFISLLVVSLAPGCSDDDDDSPSPPQGVQTGAGLCADLVLVQNSLQKALAIDPSTNVGEAVAIRNELDLALTEMEEAGEQLTTGQNANLEDTFEAFDSDVDDLSSGNVSPNQTLDDEAAPLVVRAQAIEDAVQDVEATSGCPG